MNLESFHEGIFFCTVRITVDTAQGFSIGTGFLLRANISEAPNEKGATLLVSNKHVFHESSQKIFLNFHKRAIDGQLALGETMSSSVPDFRRNTLYIEHPDSDIDLACIVVSGIESPDSHVYAKTISTRMIATYEETIFPGLEVWIVGYPAGLGDNQNNLPLLRRGYIASIPTLDYNGRKQIVIDAQIFPGSSGSPVFADLDGKFRLIGVVTETMLYPQHLEQIQVSSEMGIKEILGLGIVLKSTVLNQLVDAALTKIKNMA